MAKNSIFWRICSAATAGITLTALFALTVWTGVAAVSRVGTELAVALRWGSPGL